jgi:hypothetical protein
MAGSAELTHPVAFERDGVLYVVGIRDGEYRVRRSADYGRSWLPFGDGTTEKAVAPATTDQRAGLVKLSTQGRALLVCVPAWPQLVFYTSVDDGETWVEESRI